MNYLGIDIGTSGCKALVFGEDGTQKAAAYREYPVLVTPGGGAELDSADVMAKCLQVIREAAAQVEAGSIRALGISSQGEAFTPLGSRGEPLHNAMVSSDTRSAPYIGRWLEQFGEDRLYRITGHTAHPMFTLFKLAWLKDTHPDVWRSAGRFLCFEDLLQSRLGVDAAMGWPLAGRTMMFDVVRHCWAGEILERVGVRHDQLARPLQSGSAAGVVSGDVARGLGLREDTVVVTGGHDQAVGALGAGVTEPGVAMYGTGTVDNISPAFNEPVFSDELKKSNLCTYDHTVPGMYTTVAFSLTGGNILKWFRDEFGQSEAAEAENSGRSAYELLLQKASREPSDLLVLPYWTPSGTPYFDAQTPGAIIGLRLSTSRGEIIRALLEGVAMEMRLNLQIMEAAGCAVRELRAIGGGAKSEYWIRLKADVIGKPITILNVTEAGCMGAAMLAASADTGVPVQDLAARWVHPVGAVEPDPARATFYAEKMQQYDRLYSAVRPIYSV